jgi:cobalt-zinc-cadmium efflux system membrane fusion protein
VDEQDQIQSGETTGVRVSRGRAVAIAAVIAVVAGVGATWTMTHRPAARTALSEPEISSQGKRGARLYIPTSSEWATLTTEKVEDCGFRSEHLTEGKIAVDEDRSTPIFSPYSGRVGASRCSWSRQPIPCRRRTTSSPPSRR